MKNSLSFHISLAAALFALPLSAMAENLHIATGTTSLVVDATKGEPLKFVYYGQSLSEPEVANLTAAGVHTFNAYPVYGLWPEKEVAFSAVHTDGNMTRHGRDRHLDREGCQWSQHCGSDNEGPCLSLLYKGELPHLSPRRGDQTWSDAWHEEKGNVKLTRFMSGYLPIRRSNVHLSQLYGSWANEGKLKRPHCPTDSRRSRTRMG